MPHSDVLPIARLVIQVHNTVPRRPCGVIVMAGDKKIAAITLAELRRVATQIDAMEIAVQYHLSPREQRDDDQWD